MSQQSQKFSCAAHASGALAAHREVLILAHPGVRVATKSHAEKPDAHKSAGFFIVQRRVNGAASPEGELRREPSVQAAQGIHS